MGLKYFRCPKCGTISPNPKSCCREFEGLLFRFERRRYPNRTFTWVFVRALNEEWISLGDPWPSVTPKRSEMLAVAKRLLGI